MTEKCKQKRPRRKPWAQSAEKGSHESDFTGSGVLLGSHLPSAESTGVAAVAAAGLNAGPVFELDLVAVLKNNVSNSNIEILCTVISRQIKLSARRSCTLTLDSDGIIQIVYVILALASAVYSKLEVTLSHASYLPFDISFHKLFEQIHFLLFLVLLSF